MRGDGGVEAPPELAFIVAQIGGGEFVLGGEGAIEAGLGDAGPGDDLVDADRADALAIEQLAGALADAVRGARRPLELGRRDGGCDIG